jgi:hypothetical protein
MGAINDEIMRYAREHAGETCADIPSEHRHDVRYLVVRQL